MRIKTIFLALLLVSLLPPGISNASRHSVAEADSLDEQIITLRGQADYAMALERARALLSHLQRTPGSQPWKLVDTEKLIETLEFAVGLSGEEQRELAEADKMTELLEDLYMKGEYAEAAAKAERQLAIRTRILGKKHSDVAETLGNLGLFLQKQGDFTGAERRMNEALAIQEGVWQVVHPEVATTLNNLALLRWQQGDYEGARQVFLKVLSIQREVYEQEHADIVRTLGNIAVPAVPEFFASHVPS